MPGRRLTLSVPPKSLTLVPCPGRVADDSDAPEDRPRCEALPADRPRRHQEGVPEVPHPGRADRPAGQAHRLHPPSPGRDSPLPVRPERNGRRGPGGGRGRRGVRAPAGHRAGRAHPRGRGEPRGAGRDPRRGAGAAAHHAPRPPHDPGGETEVLEHPQGGAGDAAPLQADVSRGPEAPGRHRAVRPEEPDHRPHPRGPAVPLVARAGGAGVERRDRPLHGREREHGRPAEGDRAHRLLLDRHLAAQPVQEPRQRLRHPRGLREGGGPPHVLPPARERGHQDLDRLRADQPGRGHAVQPGVVERLPLPLLGRRERRQPRHRSLHGDPARRPAAQAQPVLLRPGPLLLRRGPVQDRRGGGLSRRGPDRDLRDPRQGRDLRRDQEVSRQGPVNLPPQIEKARRQIETHAREYGLDFYDVVFEVLDYDQLNEVAAYGGFPTRYPHWRFGMEYEELAKTYSYGLSKIYELVVNTNPVYAYLMKAKAPVEQKLVMAHVFGHADFFKNNLWFSKTNRRMIDIMANHATRVRQHIDRYGVEAVEDFIDACLSLENLIDYHAHFIERLDKKERTVAGAEDEEETLEVPRLKSKRYMETYINPPALMEEQKAKIAEKRKRKRMLPEEPRRDVLQFLLEHAPLENWERDILAMVRDEAYYFAPQAMTKISNEGWAAYWHSVIMTQRALTDSEVIDFADHHSGTLAMSPGRLNPYKIGIELFRDVEDRWNKGKFGKDYDDCDDREVRKRWDRKLGLGRQKIFEVRKIYNDVMFIDAFMTEEFCERLKLYVYGHDTRTGRPVIVSKDWRKVKERLLFSLTNLGQPIVHVVDANYGNRGELYLKHRYESVPLDLDKARDTLKNLHRIWRRPVHIETMDDERGRLLSYDGAEHKTTRL